MPLINGLHKAKLPDIRRAKGCLEWLYVGANRAMRSSSRAPVDFSSPGEPRLPIAPCAWKAIHLYEMAHFPGTRRVPPCELIPSITLTFLLCRLSDNSALRQHHV
jgi:hypothetical protein